MFSHAVSDFWRTLFLSGAVLYRENAFIIAVDPHLRHERRVMVLETVDGRVTAVVASALADNLHLGQGQGLSEQTLRRLLHEAGVVLHGADYLFYLSEADKQTLSQQGNPDGVRRLIADDAAVFAEFQSSAPEQDLDDAYVELDHWAMFGAFEHNRVVTAASMYPWEDALVADLGVLTLPPSRGRGHARRVVRSISKYACDQEYEPQYRCQLDNQASISLARAAGFTLFGKWEVVSPNSGD